MSAPAPKHTDVPNAPPAKPSGDVVLVIDHDPGVAPLMQMMLAGHGYRIEACTQIPKEIQSEHLVAIVLDRNLGTADAADVIGRVQHMAPGVPVIILSVDRSVDLVVRAIKFGAFDFITKPLTDERLVAVLHDAREHRNKAVQSGGTSRSSPQALHAPVSTGPAASPQFEVKRIDDMEREAIQIALAQTNDSPATAAKLLGISTATIYRKIKQYSLNRMQCA